jgi:hypothetical protein
MLHHRLRKRPLLVLPADHAAVLQVPNQVRHEQRIALSAGVEQVDEARREVVPGALEGQVVDKVFAGEELDRGLPRQAARLQLELHLHQRVFLPLQVGGAVRAEHQHPSRFEPGSDIGEQVDGRGVRPVEIIEQEHHRALAAQTLQERRQLPFQPLLGGRLHVRQQPGRRRVV